MLYCLSCVMLSYDVCNVMCYVTLTVMCHVILSSVMLHWLTCVILYCHVSCYTVMCHVPWCYLVSSHPPWPPAGRSSAGCRCCHHFPSPETDPEDALYVHCNLSLCSVATHPGPEPAPAYDCGLPHLPRAVPPRQLDWLHRGGEGQVGGQSEESTKYSYI